jgi:hypothetical protein
MGRGLLPAALSSTNILRAMEIPIYTFNRVIRPIAKELEVDLFPTLGPCGPERGENRTARRERVPATRQRPTGGNVSSPMATLDATRASAQPETVKAVHDDDLVAYLESLGVDTTQPTLGQCKFCREPVTLENLAALFPESGALKLACDRPACLLALQELLLDGKVRL